MSPPTPRFRDLRRHRERAAASYDDADFVHRTCADGLLERLAPMTREPQLIVDLGAGTGRLSRELAKSYRRARVISVDIAHGMLRRGRQRRSFLSRVRELQADPARLPLADGSVDLLVANQLLPLASLDKVLQEAARVLRREGLFLFASLGPASLASLRDAFADDTPHVFDFPDMHEVGDALVRAGLGDPVLDVDPLEVSYRSTADLYRDLAAVGARNSLAGRRSTLTAPGRFRAADARLASAMRNGRLHVELELVYGHAWGRGARPDGGEQRVPLSEIGIRRRPG